METCIYTKVGQFKIRFLLNCKFNNNLSGPPVRRPLIGGCPGQKAPAIPFHIPVRCTSKSFLARLFYKHFAAPAPFFRGCGLPGYFGALHLKKRLLSFCAINITPRCGLPFVFIVQRFVGAAHRSR